MQIRLLLYILSLLFLISPISCTPKDSDDDDDNHQKDEDTDCTANQSGAIPGWAANPAWSASMTNCLNEMNRTTWDGVNCIPQAADGTLLGPSFGFWKGERKYSTGAQDCFDQCVECLKKGIDWHQAQTTQCHYYVKDNLFARKKHCYVGFDYGTWAEGTATE